MDNRVFYKMLLELKDVEVKTLIKGDYILVKELSREDKPKYICRFYYKSKPIISYSSDCFNTILKYFCKDYLRLSDVIAFEFDFNLKPMIGNTLLEHKEFIYNGMFFNIHQKSKNIFCVEYTLDQDKIFWELFAKLTLTDEQIEKFKTDRIAFSDYLRSEVL